MLFQEPEQRASGIVAVSEIVALAAHRDVDVSLDVCATHHLSLHCSSSPAHSPTIVETNAVNRGWSHMDQAMMLGSFAAMSTAYAVCNMPITVATTQQQCLRESLSLPRVLRSIYASHGVRGLYRGFSASLIGGVLSDQALFLTLEFLKENMPVESASSRHFFSGVASDCIATPVWIPFSVIVSRQITAGVGVASGIRYKNVFHTMHDVVAAHGWGGLFRGTLLSFTLVPISGLWWSLYGGLKEVAYANAASLRPAALVSEEQWSLTDNVAINSVVGSVTCCAVAVVSNPFMVLRTRMQVMEIPATARWRIAWIARDILRKDGVRGFFRGLGGSMALSAVSGIGFGAFYEGIKLLSDTTKSGAAPAK